MSFEKSIVVWIHPSFPPLLCQNQIYQIPSEISELLASNYSHISSNQNYEPDFFPHKLIEESFLIDFSTIPDPSLSYYNSPITENEVLFTLHQCSKNTAPGYDQIPFIFLQKLHPNAISFFTALLNRIFHSSTFPYIWKLAIRIPNLKPNEDASHRLSNRPISLLSTVNKILEKILNHRLIWFLESNDLLNNSQYGYRKGRSSTMALTELDALIHTANTNNSNLYSVFFDLENAFPRVWCHHILYALSTSTACMDFSHNC